MPRRIRIATATIFASAFWLCGVFSIAGADEPVLSVGQDDSAISMTAGGRPVLSYLVGDVPFKPYANELYSPGGVQILRDAPADHLHHHGLMFALMVDEVDFWGEKPDRGKQLGGALCLQPAGTDDGICRAGFTQQLLWTPPESTKPVVVEDRSVTVYSGAGIDATLVTWKTELRPGPGRDAVTLTGTHYDGLGMRFVVSMDTAGQFLYAAGEPGPVVRGTNRVTPSKWAAYTAKADDRPVTVAMFDHPDNPRQPAGMFTMTSPFAYLSATPNVWKEPMELKSGQPLRLRYGIAVWDGSVDAETVDRMHGKWLRLEAGGT